MSRILTMVAALAFSALGPGVYAQGNAELSQIQRVYVLPMTAGFDQYLVNHLRGVSSMRIVTDPTKADAYFTDRLGVSFENKLKDIEEKTKEQNEPPKTEEELTAQKSGFKFAPPITSSIGRGKGTIFLVERSSRNVVWSIYNKPKDYQPKTLDRVAEKVADAFKKEATGQK
jgi:hypothetical protein